MVIEDLQRLIAQEKELQFEKFDNETAWQLGCLIKQNAEAMSGKVAIEITRNNHRLFSYAMPDTTPDNLCWIERKSNVVQRYQHSSWYVGQYYKAKGKNIEEASLVDQKHFAPFGGGFPVCVQGVGVIGSITVSGLSQYEDHQLVVDSLRQYLATDRVSEI